MLKKCALASVMFCLLMVGTLSPSAAQETRLGSNDPIAQMLREGWKIVQDGVLQREHGASQVETFVFGAPGFTWKLHDLQSQLRNLRLVYQADPTPEMRKAIANHQREIANTRKMIAVAAAADAADVIPVGKNSCSISFGYNASAAALTSSQGVTGSASANFSASCPGFSFSGEVYAYSYSTASVAGAPTTQTVTDGPRDGASVTASAYTSQTGVPTCTSYGYASMTSSNLSPSSYTISATNSSCPAVVTNPVPTISGPTYVGAFSGCTTTTWTASATGGTSPYTYQWTWNGSSVSTTSSYSRTVCSGGIGSDTFNTLGLTVTDSASRTGSTSISVEVDKGGSGGTGCLASDSVICP
jgi:hypothetical protein